MSDELTLGQRELGVADELTAEEVEYLEKNEVTLTELAEVFGVTNSRMTLDAAIGAALNIKKARAEDKEIADPRGLGIADPANPDEPTEASLGEGTLADDEG